MLSFINDTIFMYNQVILVLHISYFNIIIYIYIHSNANGCSFVYIETVSKCLNEVETRVRLRIIIITALINPELINIH